MSTLAWIVLGAAAWCALAMAIALLVGRTARLRDRHVPPDVLGNVAEFVPDPRGGRDDASVRSSDGPAGPGGPGG